MNKSYQIWEAAKDAAEANPGKPSLVVCISGTFTLTWTPKAELKGTDLASRALPPSSPVADSPTKDYLAACEVLPDSLGRPLAARIQLVLDNLRRESHIGCELRRELDGGIERDAKAVEERWPEAAAYLRSHTHIEDGV